MKRRLLSIILLSIVLISTVSAKGMKIFDLHDQYFSGTMLKKGENGYGHENRYELEKVIVTTDTRFNGYRYMYGLFTVDIKEPLVNWNVNIKKKNGTGEKHELTAIRLTSDTGSSYFITFDGGSWSNQTGENTAIQINDKEIKIANLQDKILNLSIALKNNKIKFSLNGKGLLLQSINGFGNLEKVEVELNDNRYDDELLSLDIYKAK